MKHLYHVLAVVFAATFGTLFFGIGASATSIGAALIFSLLSTVLVVPLGVGLLILARNMFGLIQAGRLLQMLLFWALMWLALAIAPVAFIVAAQGWLASLVILVATMVMAGLTGGFSSSFKRSWLPQFKKKQ